MKDIEIFEYSGNGYKGIVNFESWRIAIANYAERFDKKNIKSLSRHLLTDEAFILLNGSATLGIGEECAEVPMEPYKIYNVKKGAWHAIWMSEDAKVLIVENDNTNETNTEYMDIDRKAR